MHGNDWSAFSAVATTFVSILGAGTFVASTGRSAVFVPATSHFPDDEDGSIRLVVGVLCAEQKVPSSRQQSAFANW
jgi:hypothetical protein